MDTDRIVIENKLSYAVYDGYPVTAHHALIISKRHAETYFDLMPEEREACHELLLEMKRYIQQEDGTVTGFNIGMNAGASAGQTIFHCHTHLIPRRDGDIADPRGGVRGVIPGKRNY